jgi:hypothetical protein
MSVAAGTFVIVVTQRQLMRARQHLSDAHAALIQTARDARTIVELRSQSQTIETRQRPAQDVIAQVNAVLADLGITSAHLQSLTPEADAAIGQGTGGGPTNLRQQSLRLTLQALSPQQIGQFLQQWHAAQKIWHAARLELIHNRQQPDGNLYDATIVMTAWYVADAPSVGPEDKERS